MFRFNVSAGVAAVNCPHFRREIAVTDGGKTGLKYSVARNVVALAADTVTSCCPVASRLNFDVKNCNPSYFNSFV